MPRYALTIQQKLDTVEQFVLSHMMTLTRSLVRKSDHVDVVAKFKPGSAPTNSAPTLGRQET